MYYHVKIQTKSDEECKADLTLEQLSSVIVEPYEKGQELFINGRAIPPADIERVNIHRSENKIEYYILLIKAEDRESSVTFIGGPSYRQQAISRTKDVTDQFLFGPPGGGGKSISKDEGIKGFDKSKVFIVHGHDETEQTKVARYVEKLGLQAIILHEKASSGRTIIEKIEDYSDVGFAIILYTPDDVGNVKGGDGLNARARQNVVFEHGYLTGKLGRENVAALVTPPIELPNDISGVVYITVDEAGAWHVKLAKELVHSGCKIDMNDLL